MLRHKGELYTFFTLIVGDCDQIAVVKKATVTPPGPDSPPPGRVNEPDIL